MPRRTTKTPTPTPPAEPALISVPAAAALLGTTERFVRRLVAERRLRYYKIGTHVRFNPADVSDYKIASRVEPMRDPL